MAIFDLEQSRPIIDIQVRMNQRASRRTDPRARHRPSNSLALRILDDARNAHSFDREAFARNELAAYRQTIEDKFSRFEWAADESWVHGAAIHVADCRARRCRCPQSTPSQARVPDGSQQQQQLQQQQSSASLRREYD